MLWAWLACTTLVVFPEEQSLPQDTGTPNPLDSWEDTGSIQPEPLRLSPTQAPSLDADVAELWVGCTLAIEVWIENASSQTLTVVGLLADSTSEEFSLDPDFTTNGTLPWRVIPGDHRSLWVAYTPVDEDFDLIRVDVQAEGAGADALRLELNGRGRYFRRISEPFKANLQSDPTRYTLGEVPVPGSISVAVDGVQVGFTLEAPMTVVLDQAPSVDPVQIDYAVGPEDCP